MNMQGDGNSDEYIVTALQIFEYCGVDKARTIRVDTLMDKFAPFIKTNRCDYAYLMSLLDPDQNNPEITVSKLAESLNKYSENQKIKVDLDESFNLKSGQGPHDSDSGISTDGFQLLEELQCELREKSHLAHQLRSQLDFTDRQHEEALAALTAERDSLQSHLNMLREENATLSHVRRDYEDMCDQLCLSERALDDARRELDAARRRLRHSSDRLHDLDAEKASLSEELSHIKKEYHSLKETYASQHVELIEFNERLRSERAELAARLDDQEEFARGLLREKVSLEMELKDMLNKTNQTHSKLDRSIDVSYTEDQMLTALDSLNAESRFSSDLVSVQSQTDLPCSDCSKRNTVPRRLKRYLWEPLRCLFQIFAVICFACAVLALHGAARHGAAWQGARAGTVPCTWRWLQPADIVDMLLSVEYGAEVPM